MHLHMGYQGHPCLVWVDELHKNYLHALYLAVRLLHLSEHRVLGRLHEGEQKRPRQWENDDLKFFFSNMNASIPAQADWVQNHK